MEKWNMHQRSKVCKQVTDQMLYKIYVCKNFEFKKEVGIETKS